MKKAMKQLFQKGISGILCAAMILTSLSIPEMTAYASQTEITDEMETADKTNDGITNESDVQDTDSEKAKESEEIPETGNKDQDSDLDADKDDANSEAGGGDLADDNADDPDETAPEADDADIEAADVEFDETQTPTPRVAGSVTLNYYVGDVEEGEEIGIYKWGGFSFYSEVENEDGEIEETAATPASWHPWANDGDTAYLMTPNDQYAGWYSINVKAESTQSGDNFEIFRSTEAGRSNSTSMIKCVNGSDTQNGDIFSAVTKNDGSVCAVKDFGTDEEHSYKLFEGTDAVNAVMRNVTLHIYSKSGVPAIVLDRNDKLTCIKENTGEEEELETQEITIGNWETNCYDMEAEEQDGWYKLTFIVPDTDKVFDLYLKTKKEDLEEYEYKWETKFKKDSTVKGDNASGVDFSPVLVEGKTFYKDGKFSESSGITFGALKKLIEDVGKLVESEYTTESWGKLATALSNANTAVTALTDAGKKDTDVDDEDSSTIADAYNNLDEAKKGLEKNSRTITFNYYAGDTAGKGVGVFTYSAKNNISSDADKTTWKFWNNPIYAMKATDYFGWYKIQLTFSGSSTDQANFQIGIEGGDSAVLACGTTSDIKSGNAYFDIYNELFTGTDTSYAVKKVAVEEDGTKKEVFKLFKGDLADAVMHNVTLNIYCESGVPAIVLDKGKKLTYVNESTTTENDLEGGTETVIGDAWAVNCYDMKEESTNWYSLSFIVPTPSAGKYFDLAIKSDGTYAWNAKFMDAKSDDKTAPDFKSALKDGKTYYYKDSVFYKSLDEINNANKKVTLGDLNELITTAQETVTDENEKQYTETSWKALTDAIDDAKEIVEKYEDEGKDDDYTDEGTSTEIKDAYDDLDAAIKGLTKKGKEIIFNYYAGDTKGKGVGIYQYGGKVSSSAAVAEGWKAWDKDPVYEMTPAGYSGWYTIPLEFTGEASANANFQVFVEDASASVFKCGGTESKDNGGNATMYAKFLEAEAGTSYAIKQFGSSYKLYEGAEDVNIAMRNVTLYVYSESGIPAIGSENKLSKVDGTNGAIGEFAPDNTVSDVNYYNMASVTGKGNWYSLTFSAPVPAQGSHEICKLYAYSDSTYTPVKTFIDNDPTEGDSDSVNFSKVFSGDAYYKNGKFYSSMDLAEGITLKMLEDLLKLEKITTIFNKGAEGYTEDSWTAFNTAYTNADTLARACRADAEKNLDGYKSDDITAKYTALLTAADAMVVVIQPSVVTLYYYSEDLEEYTNTDTDKYNLYLTTWNNTKISSTKDEVDLSQGTFNYKAYEFEKVTDENINKGFDNWYTVPVKVLAANDGKNGDGFLIQLGKAVTQDGETTHQALDPDKGLIEITFWKNKTIYEAIANAGNGGVIAIKDGKMYSSIESAELITLEDLQKLYDEAKALQKDDYREDDNWSKFQTALTEAKAVLDKGNEATGDEILAAYRSLEAAMKALAYKTSASIDVKKVALADDFITGADLSSYVSLKQSGVEFKDENGKALSDSEFFQYLKDGGTNWVRIRVWNDPYNSNGDGYGGGNSDLDKAKIIGKLATAAGMRVLIDFHYSDFWADPSKQDAPKAWEGYSLEQKEKAVYDYTLDSLNALKAAGVDVGMVQVGNETNNGICGEKGWNNMAKIFNAGSSAVKYFNANANADVAEDRKCLVAIHFADPSSSVFASYAANLANKGVEYDVFAASYYPFWHGSAESDMYEQLLKVAKTGKKVMVAETSWVTTWEDGDGHGNTSPKTTQTLAYPVSVQGQADEMVDVISNVNRINEYKDDNVNCQGLAIGVFYWEPAWISPYYVYNAGTKDESLYNKNKELWEKYGSGWASSYSTEYDPTDAGRWYGGSAVDNQAWFDFNGKALATAKMYSYIRTGASATERINEIVNVENEIIKQANVGDAIPWPESNDIVVTFNDGTKSTDKNGNTHLISTTIKWDEDQEASVNTDKAGTFTVDGTVVCEYYGVDNDDNTIKSETYDICLTLEVLSTSNILQNAGFEIADTSWKTTLSEKTQANITADSDNHHVERKNEDPHGGSYGWHFYSADAINFKIEQEVSDLKAGTYTVGGFIQGNGAASKDLQTLYVTVKPKNGSETTYKSTCTLNGWLNWVNPEIANIKVSDGDTLTVGVEIESTVGGAWGTIDDMYMYGKYGIELGDIDHGTVNVSNMEPDSGEVVNIAAMPDNGYYLSELKLIGKNVNDKTSFKDKTINPENVKYAGDAAYAPDGENGVLTLTYNGTEDQSDKTMSAAFVMPEGMVTLQAKFVEISFDSVVDISSEDVKVKGFTKSEEGEYVCDPQEYTGKKIEFDLELTYKGYKLTNADYSAQYKDNMKVTETGKAEITINAKGRKFTGSRKLYFNIVDNKVDISKAKAVLTDDDPNKVDTYYYTGVEIEPDIDKLTDKNGSEITADDKDYKIYYQKNIKVGKATMTVIAKSDSSKIKGSFTQTFTIAKRPIVDNNGNLTDGITIVAPSGGTYTGSKITPNVTVKYGNKELQKGRDYTVAYKNNVNVSKDITDNNKKPSLKITGKGNYTGVTKEYYFVISAKSISDYGMKAEAEDIAENNAPKITLKNGTKKLTLNKHYRITEIIRKKKVTEDKDVKIYKCDPETGAVDSESTVNKPNGKLAESGDYIVTLSGIEKGGYTGTQTVGFRVKDKDHLLSNAKIKVIPKSKSYTGSPVTLRAKTSGSEEIDPELEVTNSKGEALYLDTDYTISYNDVYGEATNIKAGKATVTITGKGDYAGTKSTKFTIAKRAVIKEASTTDSVANKDKAVITWDVQEDTILYKIKKKIEAKQDSADTEKTLYLPYTGYNWTPELNIYATNGSSKKLLTKGTDYTITYKNNQKASSNASVIIRGKGNYSGSVQFDNVFTVKDVTLDDFVITINPVEYNGKALKPAINFVYKETGTVVNMKAGAAYAVKYKNNKNVASIESAIKPTVTITEKGLNAGKKGTDKGYVDLPFTITTARITAASVSEIRMQTYNGKPSKPALTIKVNGKKLKAGTDYVVTYEGNTRPNDKAKAKIIGIGNYSGTVEKTFAIK